MKQKIVTLGGGTGSLMILTGLRDYAQAEVATILAMADDGGSTGRMREEYNMPSFGGDFRDALVGLAENEELARVFMHRFEHGSDLKGHSVGNIILLGLFEATKGDIPEALKIAHKILRVRGEVYPSTTESIKLGCEYDDGTVLESQHEIDNLPLMNGRKVVRAYLKPSPKAYDQALDVLRNADKIVLGPGDIYSNIVANLLVEGIADAIAESNAQVVYVCNLMTKFNQTHGWRASDFVHEVQNYLKSPIDYVIVNDSDLPEDINKKYEEEKWEMVNDDLGDDSGYKVIRDKLWLEGQEFKRVSSDVVPRSFIRHDPARIAEHIIHIPI
ncbi:MAG: Gluconeogenesis factor [candidate division WS6 bacterium OLB20]|uniref:Gluconeogenesis factor n=1 Tax=candidate division WS6 bacterium OLB20 TaxID=1617426 RepID=A0A136LW09_9BACT|nr:MAG: Gluconeogenesis factor [candidate division WS6 bacterium OLB20]